MIYCLIYLLLVVLLIGALLLAIHYQRKQEMEFFIAMNKEPTCDKHALVAEEEIGA